MQHRLWAAAAATLLVPLAYAADVGVSIQISEPGVYGRIDIGRFPQPQVVVAQPVMARPPTVVVGRPAPVYLWVPPGHRKDWGKHCGHYGACGVPVYFVQDDWYQANVMKGPPGKGQGQGKGKGNGNGNGNGQGKGRG
jgi:hypothetical protein